MLTNQEVLRVPEWALKGATPSTMALMGVRDGDKYAGWAGRDMLGLTLNELKKL